MNIKSYINLISKIDLFSNFTVKELEQLFHLHNYSIKKYNKGQIIHFQNEVCDFMDVILQGQTSVQNIDENGKILTISTFSQSDIMGINLLFSNKNYYPMTVTAKTNTILLHISRKLILELCQNNIGFLTKLITVISNKTLTLTDKINTITLKTIRECIIDFLTYEYQIQQNNIIKLSMTKKEMAQRLGIQRPSLSRELNKMRKDGLVDYDARTITIKDMSMLKSKQ